VIIVIPKIKLNTIISNLYKKAAAKVGYDNPMQQL